MASRKIPRWEYLVGHFGRRGKEMWFESSARERIAIRGGDKGFADILNTLGADGWDLVHVDDSPPRLTVEAGELSVFAWGDMIFKRPAG